MKIRLRYVDEPMRNYFYFRRGNVRLPLPGVPGTPAFQQAYDVAISQYAPELRKRRRMSGANKGSSTGLLSNSKGRRSGAIWL